jgi:TonB family protein
MVALACEAQRQTAGASSTPSAVVTPSLLIPVTATSAPSRDEPMHVSGDDVVAPQVIKRVQPDFSPLHDAHVSGHGVYGMTITAKGMVEDIHVVRSLGPKVDPIVLAALRQWRFRPATQGGRAVPVSFTITVMSHF